MVLKYFIRENGNGPYCEGDDSDILYDENCIDVQKIPSNNHLWNNLIKEWVLDEEIYMSNLRSKRNMELKRTDKFMINDYPITEENKQIAIAYRQELRDCPNQELLEDRILPICPEILMEN